MKNVTISKPNSKGQVVIPKPIRDELGINPNVYLRITSVGTSIFMHPITNTATTASESLPFSEILKKTQGAWAKDWPALKKTFAKRHALELKAAQKRKQAW